MGLVMVEWVKMEMASSANKAGSRNVWQRAVSFLVRLAIFLVYLIVVLIAVAANLFSGSFGGAIAAIATVAFVVINARLLFPWPMQKAEVLRRIHFARRTLWVGLVLALFSAVAGSPGDYAISEWRGGFMVLALALAIVGNLVVLYRLDWFFDP